MSEMPTCSSCGQPHWRFAPCAQAPALAAKEADRARESERLKVRVEYAMPPGMVRVGPNKFAKPTDHTPTYVQIAPGKFRKADSR